MSNLSEIEQRLSEFPALRKVFEHCIRDIFDRKGITVTAKGSLAHGPFDEFSDLDLLILVHDPIDTKDVQEWVRQKVSSAGSLLASFRATHIGLPNIFIFFLEVESKVVKLDIEIVSRAVHMDESSPPDFNDIGQKFCGWIWYTHTKIARGELLEAVDSLNTMRRLAVLPVLQFIHELPFEGHRRLETRLPKESLSMLHSTYPAQVQSAEIKRSLMALIELFKHCEDKLAARLGKSYQRPRLDSMLRLVEQSAAQ